MRFESFSALRGCLKNSPWLSSDKTFVAYDISQLFQGAGMAGKIAVGQRELFFQKANTPKIIKFPANRSNKPQSEAARAAPMRDNQIARGNHKYLRNRNQGYLASSEPSSPTQQAMNTPTYC